MELNAKQLIINYIHISTQVCRTPRGGIKTGILGTEILHIFM